MVPLSRQADFFVPEMMMEEEAKTELREEDSDEDRGTDITGGGLSVSHSPTLTPFYAACFKAGMLRLLLCKKVQTWNLFLPSV